jgi:hypothetical protein
MGSDFGGVGSSAAAGVVLRGAVARLLAFLAGATGVSKVSGVGNISGGGFYDCAARALRPPPAA